MELPVESDVIEFKKRKRILESTSAVNENIFVKTDGTNELISDWDAGEFKITSKTLKSDIATGTAPLEVASTTKVTNLNADLLDGLDSTSILARANHTGTQLLSTISDVTSSAAELNIMDGFTGTTANLNTLTNDSMADALHRHSELSASDGTPNPALSVDISGNVGIGTATPSVNLAVKATNPQLHLFSSSSGETATDGFQIALSSATTYLWNFENGPVIMGANNGERMRILADGTIGIGTDTPDARLEVISRGDTSTSYTARFQNSATAGAGGILFDQNNTYSWKVHTEGTSSATAGSIEFSYIAESTGATQKDDVLVLKASGDATISNKLSVGTTATAAQFNVSTPDNGIVEMLVINTPQANINASDYWTLFQSATGTEGNITGTGVAGVVAYNTFTGGHWSQGEVEELPEGSVLISIDEMCEWKGEVCNHLPKCVISTKKEDKAVYGIYGGRDRDGDIIVLGLGSCKVRVNDENGNIEVGDLLTTSSKKGEAMKYLGNDNRVILGKARQSGKNGVIACTLMCG